MEKKITSSNTKAQIMEAYEEVLKKLQEKAEEKPKEMQQRKLETKTVESAQKNNEESIIKDITRLKTSFGESLDKIEENLIKEYKKLADIQAAIKIETKNLEELYGLSANADSFAAILLTQKENKEQFEDEMKTVKEQFESEMAEAKTSWEKEQVENEAKRKEDKEQIQKTRKREEEEYTYNLQQKRKKENDTFELKKAQQEAELKNQKTSFDKEIAEREKILVDKEEEYTLLKKNAENFPKELESAVQVAKSEIETQMNQKFKFEKDITLKETEGQMQLKELQIKTLENKIKEMDTQIKILTQKAETAEKSTKDIAIKAIESSTKVQVFEKEKPTNE